MAIIWLIIYEANWFLFDWLTDNIFKGFFNKDYSKKEAILGSLQSNTKLYKLTFLYFGIWLFK